MNIISLIIEAISGAVGGNVAGAAMKENSLGTVGNSIAGILGGGAGGMILQAIMGGRWAGLYHHWLGAVLFGVVGALIVWRPVVTAEILTLLMCAFFLVAGLFQLITPFIVSLPDWGWHALNGLITLVLGILVLAQWPLSGLWVIGLFVGIELIFYGIAWIALALRLRSLA